MGLTPLQRRIAGIALLIFVVAMVWMLTHRRTAQNLPDLKPPTFLELTAKGDATPRTLANGGELAANESLDFQIQVSDLSFVYVVKVQNGALSLAWGHRAQDPVWEAGVYAPDWNGKEKGMRFSGPGEVEVYAVASPQPLVDVPTWDLATLKSPGAKCPHCGVSSVHFRVAAAK